MENNASWHHGVMNADQYKMACEELDKNAGGAFMNKIHNRQVVCETLIEIAKSDKDNSFMQ